MIDIGEEIPEGWYVARENDVEVVIRSVGQPVASVRLRGGTLIRVEWESRGFDVQDREFIELEDAREFVVDLAVDFEETGSFDSVA